MPWSEVREVAEGDPLWIGVGALTFVFMNFLMLIMYAPTYVVGWVIKRLGLA